LRSCDILAAAPRWGRRLAFAALAFIVAGPVLADDPAPQSLHAAGLLTLPAPCLVSRDELL